MVLLAFTVAPTSFVVPLFFKVCFICSITILFYFIFLRFVLHFQLLFYFVAFLLKYGPAFAHNHILLLISVCPSVWVSWRALAWTRSFTQRCHFRCWTGTAVLAQKRSVTTPGACAATNNNWAAWGASLKTASSSVSFTGYTAFLKWIIILVKDYNQLRKYLWKLHHSAHLIIKLYRNKRLKQQLT